MIESKGLVCLRADEIRHSGSIDLPMYQQLLTADVVIADLSTANVNAFYELGIRHAMRPKTTIVISEQQLNYPFDLNHILINKYTHLGKNIDYFEVLRFQKLLGETIDAVLTTKDADSPVYTFLDGLIPPKLKKKAEEAARALGEAMDAKTNNFALDEEDGESQTLSLIIRQGEEALKNKQFLLAKGLFESALIISKCDTSGEIVSNNSYLLHRLALSTYKSKLPDAISALKAAMSLLKRLDLHHTNDPETVSLAGKIEKRLYVNGEGNDHLKNAILYYERGFYLLNNRYHGINLAFLLNTRANSSVFTSKEDKIADMIWANRIRRDVLAMCEKELNELRQRMTQPGENMTSANGQDLLANQLEAQNEQLFWIYVNKAEAHFGLDEMEEYKTAKEAAKQVPVEPWMLNSFEKQVTVIREIMGRYGDLLNPQWHGNLA